MCQVLLAQYQRQQNPGRAAQTRFVLQDTIATALSDCRTVKRHALVLSIPRCFCYAFGGIPQFAGAETPKFHTAYREEPRLLEARVTIILSNITTPRAAL